ncbi:VOC family protein [Nocardia stercoris]|uniref:Glyoxalase/bleomycin resistance/dioxygenase family protein n=1 Tax=Nocardia stercoris TaxID=2483361 RepID=A0A3M2KTR4_9NOCA|nr:glyoxalase/bleomycin resistance/dioxygenase family protein [Nocardia stercoris]RMI28859.1 glyoxalase/bleomycin resistance/dioxygenase family protein [Nocardia stercoris]
MKVNLIVIYTPRLEQCHRFYTDLGLPLTLERHGRGPEHFAAELADGSVFELYPARPDRTTGDLRLGLTIDGSAAKPPLATGRHLLTDPDGRTIEVLA